MPLCSSYLCIKSHHQAGSHHQPQDNHGRLVDVHHVPVERRHALGVQVQAASLVQERVVVLKTWNNEGKLLIFGKVMYRFKLKFLGFLNANFGYF